MGAFADSRFVRIFATTLATVMFLVSLAVGHLVFREYGLMWLFVYILFGWEAVGAIVFLAGCILFVLLYAMIALPITVVAGALNRNQSHGSVKKEAA